MAKLFGIYRAVVVSADDPARRRRLLVTLPEARSEALWAEPCVPAGSRAMPRAGAIVWIQFETGNVDKPVWIGTHPSAA